MATSELIDLNENTVVREFDKDYKNARGIPRAEFIESVQDFLTREKLSADENVTRLQEQHNKYTMLEVKLKQRRDGLRTKLPEIKNTLRALFFLTQQQNKGEELKTHFQLADQVFSEANIDTTGKAGLWLGANVMVEYTYDEAKELLEANLKTCVHQLDELNEDLAFLRDQITTTEVNMSRTYNYGVKLRKEAKASK